MRWRGISRWCLGLRTFFSCSQKSTECQSADAVGIWDSMIHANAVYTIRVDIFLLLLGVCWVSVVCEFARAPL